MRFNMLLKRALYVGFGVALLMAGSFGSASAQSDRNSSDQAGDYPGGLAPLPERGDVLIVNITDSGFEQQSYTVRGSSTAALNTVARVTFKNNGARVHTATAPAGVYAPVALIQRMNPSGSAPGTGNNVSDGTAFTCDMMGKSVIAGDFGCGRLGPLDTGGIAPGWSVTVAIGGSGAKNTACTAGQCASGNPGTSPDDNTWTFTSAPDCISGDRPNPSTFNCEPVSIKLSGSPKTISYPWGSSSVYGSTFDRPSNPDCALGSTVIPATGTATCLVPYRHFITAQGTTAKPLDSVTINVDDVEGYQPTFAFVKMGGTITWINKGQNAHTLTNLAPAFPIWSGPFASLTGINGRAGQNDGIFLAPGATFVWNTPPAPYQMNKDTGQAPVCKTCAVNSVTQSLQSRILGDLIPPKFNGIPTSAGTSVAGGTSGIYGAVIMVDPK
jgi:plastocyanin